MVHIYQDHLYGDYYLSSEEQSYNDLYCEQCGDSDSYLGEYESMDEFINQIIFNSLEDFANILCSFKKEQIDEIIFGYRIKAEKVDENET